MAAVGIQLGRADEGSSPGGPAGGAGRLHSGRAGIACGPARLPAGPCVGGGGRDATWR